MDFSNALWSLKGGFKIAREGWNGKGMWLEFVPAAQWESEVCVDAERCPFIAMKTADNKWVPWLASQTYLLANDWLVT